MGRRGACAARSDARVVRGDRRRDRRQCALFSFAQEYRAERAVEELRRILPQRVRVRRDGRPQEVDAVEAVPGDVVLLVAGDRVPADGELLAEVQLRIDMSTLTGESRPVRRHVSTGPHGRSGLDAPDR